MPARKILGADNRNSSRSKDAPRLADKVIEALDVLDDLICVYHVEGAVLEWPRGFEVTISNVELSTLRDIPSLGHDLDSGDVGRRNAHSMAKALGPQSVIAADVEKREGRVAWKDIQDLPPILGIHRLVQACMRSLIPAGSRRRSAGIWWKATLESQAGVFISRFDRYRPCYAHMWRGPALATCRGCGLLRTPARAPRTTPPQSGTLRTSGRYSSRRRGRQRE